MKIAVKKITNQPLTIKEKIEASSWDMDSFDIVFVGDIDIICTFSKKENLFLVNSSVKTTRRIICSRCLEVVTENYVDEINLHYRQSEVGEFLEVDNDLREDILLKFPMKVLCKSNCQGLCPECGVNLNKEQCKCVKVF